MFRFITNTHLNFYSKNNFTFEFDDYDSSVKYYSFSLLYYNDKKWI